jgi:predicted nucleic acid-binding protein
VVYDVQLLVNAVVGTGSTYPLLGRVPPTSSNPAADCLSIAFDADDYRLYSSPHILTDTARALHGLGVREEHVERYVDELVDIVATSGGQVVDPPRTVFDVPDYEDNPVLDLVVAVDALLLVSDDTDLTTLSPWYGRSILRPRDFVARVAAGRRR